MKQNLQSYELLVEDLATENTKLILENTALKKQETAKKEVTELKSILDKFKFVNQKLMTENEDLKHKYEVAEKLHQMMKEHFHKYVHKSLSAVDTSVSDEPTQHNSVLISELLGNKWTNNSPEKFT